MWGFGWMCNQLRKEKSNLLNLCSPAGDPGYDRTAQAEQRNVQQGFQQLLLQRRRPHPRFTGQSRQWRVIRASGSSHEFIPLTFIRPWAALHLWLRSYRRRKSRIKKIFFSSLTLADVVSGKLSQQSSLSWPNREGWSLSVYKTLMDLFWPTLGWWSGAEHSTHIRKFWLTPSGEGV